MPIVLKINIMFRKEKVSRVVKVKHGKIEKRDFVFLSLDKKNSFKALRT